MEDIDSEMIAEGIKISARPFVAGLKITGRYNVTLDACPPRRPPKQGCFDPPEISIRIHDWIELRYGKRVNIPFHIGRIVLPLRGALYKINCPITWGHVQFICEPQSFSQPRDALGLNAPPTVNMIDLVEDLTRDLAHSLTAEEVVRIGIAFVAGMGVYSALRVIRDVEYAHEALGDFDAAVFHLMEHEPQPGLSKWASLQAVEKLIKGYISQRGNPVRRIHSLKELCEEAAGLGLPRPPEDYVKTVECSAGIRYGEVAVSVDEALKAHLVSLEMCEVAARYIGNHLKRRMPVVPEPRVDGMPISQFLRTYVKER
jgi:HEPN domain-containing protein